VALRTASYNAFPRVKQKHQKKKKKKKKEISI
jgi:hypothetical protein